MLRYPTFSSRQRIGLYGGSFNPPHEGHLAVAKAAIRCLDLHKIWWLVSPMNPLKSAGATADYAKRLEQTRSLAAHPHMEVCDLEMQSGAQCTADMLRTMAPVLDRGRFVWIMGADSFAELHNWQRWQTIAETIPLCVFDRPGSGFKALGQRAAIRYAHARVDARNASTLPDLHAVAWSFIAWPLRSESSTAIREGQQAINPMSVP